MQKCLNDSLRSSQTSQQKHEARELKISPKCHPTFTSREIQSCKTTCSERREINKMSKSLPKLDNTMLSKFDLEKYAGAWNTHLKLIADYLRPGEGV